MEDGKNTPMQGTLLLSSVVDMPRLSRAGFPRRLQSVWHPAREPSIDVRLE